MRYSIEPFLKNMSKNISNKLIQKLILKLLQRRTAEATGDLSGNKTADKITSVSKISPKELNIQGYEANNEIEIAKERYISPRKRQQKIDELRLVK